MRLSLASAFAVIGKDAQALESKADNVLRIVKGAKIKDGSAWNAAVRKAYKANGWNGKPGKPKAADKAATVPATVKQYVSAIRRAFRLKLPVASYSSFYALRQDLKVKAKPAKRSNGAYNPATSGVHLAKPDVLTGGPFHDLVVIYDALDKPRQAKMLHAIGNVKRQFASGVPQLVVASLPEMRKAA